MKEIRKKSYVGSVDMEIQQIEELQHMNEKEAIEVQAFTEEWGGVLTLICC